MRCVQRRPAVALRRLHRCRRRGGVWPGWRMTTDSMADADESWSTLAVTAREQIAADIWQFTLAPIVGASSERLPEFTAGSHLTVITPAGMRRNYSLCGAPADRSRYQIAVKREANGRGGSRSMVDEVAAGAHLMVSNPRNNFGLDKRAKSFLFVAGGIGITPILSMMRHLKAGGGVPFHLYYCTRDAASTAFADELTNEFPGQITLHHDGGDVAKAFDFWPVFESPTAAHIYCCGPRGLMEAVADMTGHWPSGAIHFESFGLGAAAQAENAAFDVRLRSSGQVIHVAKDKSVLDALRAAGIAVRSSCESGTCGSCKTGLVAGEADHRDMVLTDDERAGNVMVCVSRAKSAELVLDL